jgi:hypothetical protein
MFGEEGFAIATRALAVYDIILKLVQIASFLNLLTTTSTKIFSISKEPNS